MKTYDFDDLMRDFMGLGDIAMQSDFAKNIQKIFNTEDVKPGAGCGFGMTFNGILCSRAKTYDDKYVVIAEVPGLTEDDITIEFKDGLLTLKAKYENQLENDFNYLRNGSYVATFKAKDADGENITAKMDKGQIVVTLPKKAEAQPIKVQINKG